MKIAVVGVGAMGSIYAALLADAGHEVWAVDTWADHVEAISARGLRVEGASGDRTVTGLRATTASADAGPCDLFIIATKADGVAAAARSITPQLGADSIVVTIQNGLGAAERIAEHLPPGHLLLGVAEGFGASIVGPGHVRHASMRQIRIGEPAGGASARVDRVVDVWRGAGFEAQGFDDIEQLIWEKFLCNVTLSGPCTTFDCTVGELMDDPARWRVALGCLDEAHRLGTARGVAFSFDDPVAYVTEFAGRLAAARPSMLLDHQAGRRSEIDAINGQVVTIGDRLGVDTPYNDVVCAAVLAREVTFDPPVL